MHQKKVTDNIKVTEGSNRKVKITIIGVGGHSSSPHLATNALVVAGQVIKAINSEVAYRFAADQRPEVIPVSLSSGTASNIIPAKAEIQYELMVHGEENSQILYRIFNEIPLVITRIHGAVSKVELYEI